jgi:uncharacterized membrane protein
MSNQLHNELKKEFQLERLILFSDAVFAIAITLLVIELKIPDIHGVRDPVTNQIVPVTDSKLLYALHKLVPKFMGFLVSFILIGLYWTIHHRMFGFVTSYDKRLIQLNLLFLFFIVLLPFSSGFYSEYAGSDMVEQQIKVPLTFYALNFAGAGFCNYLMWRHVSSPKYKLAEPPIDPLIIKLAKIRSLIVPIIFLLMPIVAQFNALAAMYVPLLIPFTIRILRKKFTADHNKAIAKKIK